MYGGVRPDRPFEIVMRSKDVETRKTALFRDFRAVTDAFSGMDVEQASAFDPADLAAIKSAIAESVGFD